MSLIPPRDAWSFACSRFIPRSSRFVSPSTPLSSFSSMDFRRLIEFETVCQLVSVPPSHLWLM